jgi:hypothetical protein
MQRRPVELQFVAGDEHSQMLTIELTPPPPAPGAFGLTVETIVAELRPGVGGGHRSRRARGGRA